jgi:uncharacterized membrane protein
MLGEYPSRVGIFGVLLIVAGAYILNIKQYKVGYLEPFKSIIREKGSRLMLIVAVIYSIGSNIDKIGITNSSPLFWIIATNFASAIVLLPFIFRKKSGQRLKNKKNILMLVLIGLASGISLIAQMYAINIANVAYVIAIKRTSAIMTVIFGFLLFKEKGIKERLFGVVIMVLGVMLISFS